MWCRYGVSVDRGKNVCSQMQKESAGMEEFLTDDGSKRVVKNF